MGLTTEIKRYSDLLDIILDEVNVKQFRLTNGTDENGEEVAVVYDGNWYLLHGEEKIEFKNRQNILKACQKYFNGKLPVV